ncbi:hypothetical protein Y11_41291 [Yersinia enterocolitica subsp. palearctica Y11]|uniref:Uncharacterized protein n=2 Tax=Yersinia enterocolitica TaxID=630 RepID=A0A0H3NV10_YERE1|nr:unknown protein [Yersinia enterocolitica W22703]CBY28401.1 hypothetical protein Y11_41291 [Yersinia enterocolitica subsp. palearctica Y11]CCO66938.1 hypothetical protein D322_41 [Yersinia enterocolitica IP 10393]
MPPSCILKSIGYRADQKVKSGLVYQRAPVVKREQGEI